MKKRILALLLALALLTACSPAAPETPAVPETPDTTDPLPEEPLQPETPEAPAVTPEQAAETVAAFRKAAEDIEEYEDQWTANAMNQAEINSSAAETFRRWDEVYQQILQFWKQTMTEEEAASLDAEEQLWAENREKAQKDASAQWAGGSGAPLAYYKTGCSLTKTHCEDLLQRIETAFGG